MIRVMLIDDEEDALDLLEILLGQLGNVQVVGRYMNPAEAAQVIQALQDGGQGLIDAVFLDYQMPGMNGMEAARAIRQMIPQIPIIFTTAHAQYAVEAFEIQSIDYLLKPFTPDRLQNAVARVQHYMTRSPLGSSSSVPSEAGPIENLSAAIQCLGGFQIRLPGNGSRVLSWKTKKAKELCALLIHADGESLSTAAILEAIWPGYDLNKAKTYLYTCLSYLRKSLTENQIPIHIHKVHMGFVAEWDGMKLDVAEFKHLVSQFKEPSPQPDHIAATEMDAQLYDQMNQLYKGDYMDACDFRWAEPRQLEIRGAYIRALRVWYAHFRKQGHASLAVDSMQRILELLPDSEQDGRELIRLHLDMGNRYEAHQVGVQLEQAVCLQLGADLEEQTVLLIQRTKEKAEWKKR
ncbi:response regulator [Paenibacillus sanguinis]|uniref:response regulator n=1 Tax=Paenibacillus sanguinis TaxID=225906 RepID=UPI00037FFA14|nr:response regulator [Paenibacillus sanguinis]